MINITIEPKLFRAAFSCAAKNGTRYYTNGCFIDHEHTRLVGTNGRIMASVPVDGELDESIIIPFPPKLPGKSVIAVTVELKDGSAYISYHASKGAEQFIVQPIDGEFPDYQRVLVDKKRKSVPVDQIQFNPLLLTDLCKEFNDVPIFNFDGNVRAIDVTFKKHAVDVTLMPCH